MKNLLYLISSLLLVGACSVEESGEITEPALSGTNQATIQVIAVEALQHYGFRSPSGLIKNGQQMVVSDLRNTENIYQINLSNQGKQAYFPRVRTRSGVATVLNSLSPDSGGGWTVFDFRTGQLSGHASTPITRSGSEVSVTLPSGEQHLQAVCAGRYVLSTGLYEQGRYLLYSPEQDVANYYLSYPDHPEYTRLKAKTRSILYASSVLKVRPDHGAFVCADMYSGTMDVCRIADDRIELVRRLCWHAPKVVIREKRKWPQVAYRRDNPLGFTDVAVTADRIYAVYSGRTYREYQSKFQRCRTLLVMDWEGNVLNTYALDTDVTHISYDPVEKALYGIGYSPEMTLVRLDI